MRKHKFLLTAILALLLLCGTTIPAMSADPTLASTIRLEKIEGTVCVRNSAGTEKKVKEGGRLYSGYTVTTDESSYAYVSLDKSKTVKLDESTQIKVHKSGKKLEVLISYGELFFNVTKPVASDESFSICTSTMLMGIHGTSGFARQEGTDGSEYIALLEGALTVERKTDSAESFAITGGEFVSLAEPVNGKPQPMTTGSYSGDEIPGFVAVEISADEELQEKIREKAPELAEDLDIVIEEAEDRLKAEQEATAKLAGERKQALDQEIANIPGAQTVETNTPSTTSTPEPVYCKVSFTCPGSEDLVEVYGPYAVKDQREYTVEEGGRFWFSIGFTRDIGPETTVTVYVNGEQVKPISSKSTAYDLGVVNGDTEVVINVAE